MIPKDPINFPMNRTRSQMLRTRFAIKFLRSMKKLNQKTTPSMSFRRRGHMVKVAAYASMASAVGSRRKWSRALLCRLKEKRNARLKRENPKISCVNEADSCSGSGLGLDGLRRLVPGGETMEASSLFDETAHYIKCLTIQVQMMRKFVHVYSSG